MSNRISSKTDAERKALGLSSRPCKPNFRRLNATEKDALAQRKATRLAWVIAAIMTAVVLLAPVVIKLLSE